MKMFAFLAFAVMLLSIYSQNDFKEVDTSSEVKALNFLIYRKNVMGYVFANNSVTGVIQDKDIEFPSGFVNRNWKARIQGNILYVYGKATQKEIVQAKKQTMYSHSVGSKKNGLFYPHYTTPPTVLPNFIDEGDLVSILEIEE